MEYYIVKHANTSKIDWFHNATGHPGSKRLHLRIARDWHAGGHARAGIVPGPPRWDGSQAPRRTTSRDTRQSGRATMPEIIECFWNLHTDDCSLDLVTSEDYLFNLHHFYVAESLLNFENIGELQQAGG